MAKREKVDAVDAPRWEPPDHAAMPRQGEPGRTYSISDARGVTRSITADANGIVWPQTPEATELVDAIGLPPATDWWAPLWEDDPTTDDNDQPIEPEADQED